MLTKLTRVLVLALSVLLAGTASARAADTISLSFAADPTEEVPLAVTATWSAGVANTELYVTIKPAGPLGCGASWAADTPSSESIWSGSSTNAAAGSMARNWTLRSPGTYTLCGYLQDSSSAPTPRASTGPVALTVRSAQASVAISAPARVDAGKVFALNVPVTAELSRELYVTSKPAGGRGCEATWSLDIPNATGILGGRSVQGTSTQTTNVTASTTNGIYLLCAYVQEGSSDPSPEATASATYLVGPDPCVTARAALTKAQKVVKTAESSVTRNRKAWKSYASKAKRAHGARRSSLNRQAKKYKSRYSSAVRSRSKARAKLATAQAGVTTACGA